MVKRLYYKLAINVTNRKADKKEEKKENPKYDGFSSSGHKEIP